ncbi:hypothetical protein PHYBLDRAFT_73006 [Phycomyces blakesleeanus NRRL 1555(-)]|uniref:Uncharacterized protein n=1 Tax=Phycomyces blakesleeanus (strain ATCC 8743b / DSM 1359 / FGSC 10004 / NBRC 33097 / NRRL 1555) TaxID=763407 RepID=A0A162TFW3_PHYB8|nr:hypothetical protein PHYBLDRAFT_73006 [Phycomyces blakesleeanus NRRL 1555(-)]OAD68262.1 hypothetical protein PHYBLDRAFT_73006 [Phycomyces blakesleeanus NRRL 1555(-)]|eukprot:XP_018286302.1 hypothetical protein PHYBLDRAFT_73006 [Phycomyces blakesleeanus NRRL 1555(-)]
MVLDASTQTNVWLIIVGKVIKIGYKGAIDCTFVCVFYKIKFKVFDAPFGLAGVSIYRLNYNLPYICADFYWVHIRNSSMIDRDHLRPLVRFPFELSIIFALNIGTKDNAR